MPINPLDLMFSSYRRRLLGLMLLRPEESLYVREISRLSGVPVGSLHRELRKLSEAGLLSHRAVGNQVHYTVNRACPVYPELAQIFRKTAGLAEVLREALAPLEKKVRVAFIFGSFAAGEESPQSDVDVMILGEASLSEVVAALLPLQEYLSREINPVVMTADEFKRDLDAADRFVARVIEEPRQFLFGNEDDLGKLVAYRQPEALEFF